MTAGPFIMTNLDGLFSPFRDFESDSRFGSTRRTGRLWDEMDRRDDDTWSIFGSIFDRQMDEIHRMHSAIWNGGFFSHSRLGRSGLSSFRDDNRYNSKSENNVLVEFPQDEEEIKITLEEPSVVITEVEDPTEESPPSEESEYVTSSRSDSPVRKTVIIHNIETEEDTSPELSSTYTFSSVNKSEEEIIAQSDKAEKSEKKHKKVDFSKTEVHFEPESGKVNIVETDEKPPSNQLYRRKRRHRSHRSDSPRHSFLHHHEVYENISPHDSINQNINFEFTKLQNNLDLSIFNLRNSLFKNSINTVLDNKNNMYSPTEEINNENSYATSRLNNHANNLTNDDVQSPKSISSNYNSCSVTSFSVSSKLQDMIQNSVKNQIDISRTQIPFSENRSNRLDIHSGIDSKNQKNVLNFRLMSGQTNNNRYSSLKRSNSRSKDTLVMNNNSKASQRIMSPKNWIEDDKNSAKSKTISRDDSFKRNARVTRQESIKSTSSRGSLNNDNKISQRRLNRKESLKRDSNSRINRTPSFGKITNNSLKKGGIYVDGRPRRPRGATVTLISYSKNGESTKLTEPSDRRNSNNLTNSQASLTRNRVYRKDSLRSNCSKESLPSYQRRIPQRTSSEINTATSENVVSYQNLPKNNSLNISKYKDNLLNSTNVRVTKQNPTKYSQLKFIANNNVNSKIASVSDIRNPEKIHDILGCNGSDLSPISSSLTLSSGDKTSVAQEVDRINKSFNHEKTSLFKPIKKEKSIHSSESSVNDIKMPVAVRNIEIDILSPSKLKSNGKVNEKVDSKIPNTASSKILSSLRRSKEPLRSFEKISNGWVGRCNVSSVNRDVKADTKWGTKRVSQMKPSTQLSNFNDKSGFISDNRNANPPFNPAPRTTFHQQKESVMRLTRGYPSRRVDSPSGLPMKLTETRKRTRNLYTPSSISSQSSVVGAATKRKQQYAKPDNSNGEYFEKSNDSEITVPVYETLNSRRNAPTASTLVRRSRNSNPCFSSLYDCAEAAMSSFVSNEKLGAELYKSSVEMVMLDLNKYNPFESETKTNQQGSQEDLSLPTIEL